MSFFAFKATTHPTATATLGRNVNVHGMEALLDQPGPIKLETVAADWRADLSGLINLKHPLAVKAGLRDRKEPIKIFVHVVEHPRHGAFLIDTGVSRRFVEEPADVGVGWLLRKFFGIEEMQATKKTDQIIKDLKAPLKGVFLTHLHLDHVSGLPDVPKHVPIYIGPHEADSATMINGIVQGTNDRLLQGRPPLQELKFAKDDDNVLEGILDVFEDGSMFAVHSPGHTEGHLAFVLRTESGPVLLTGDVCHTRWGWENAVEPGSYTEKPGPARKSLDALKALSARHPSMTVQLGHQL